MSMKEIMIEKVTLNIGTGEPGPKLDHSKQLIEAISGKKSVKTKSKRRSTFGVAKGRDIGVKVTLRGNGAKELLKRLLQAATNELKASCFDSTGNFSFGIPEYIDIPGVDYYPEIGIMGFDVSVTLERPGYRVKRRRYKTQQVGKRQRITREDAMGWVKKEFGVSVS